MAGVLLSDQESLFSKRNLITKSSSNTNIETEKDKSTKLLFTSNDLQRINQLNSPEIEKYLILNSKGVICTTPTPTTSFPVKTPTEEEEKYAMGFVEALNNLYDTRGQPKFLNTNNVLQKIIVKSETSTLPTKLFNPELPITASSPTLSLSPVCIENQEKLKIDYKRERNRVAARKCRYKKLEKIEQLQKNVDELEEYNNKLIEEKQLLSKSINNLKQSIIEHKRSGCCINIPSNLT